MVLQTKAIKSLSEKEIQQILIYLTKSTKFKKLFKDPFFKDLFEPGTTKATKYNKLETLFNDGENSVVFDFEVSNTADPDSGIVELKAVRVGPPRSLHSDRKPIAKENLDKLIPDIQKIEKEQNKEKLKPMEAQKMELKALEAEFGTTKKELEDSKKGLESQKKSKERRQERLNKTEGKIEKMKNKSLDEDDIEQLDYLETQKKRRTARLSKAKEREKKIEKEVETQQKYHDTLEKKKTEKEKQFDLDNEAIYKKARRNLLDIGAVEAQADGAELAEKRAVPWQEKVELQQTTAAKGEPLARDPFVMATPEGRDYFDQVFKRDHKKVSKTSAHDLKKDLETKNQSYDNFYNIGNHMIKLYETRENVRHGDEYKMTTYLNKMDKTNKGISNNLISAYTKILSSF